MRHSFDTSAHHEGYAWYNQRSDTPGIPGTDRREMPGLPSAKPEKHTTVLVVDDEISIALLLAEFLEGAGYRVLLADTGRAALELARAERPALILTDCVMPGVGGAEFARRLRASPVTNDIPIVMMSSTRPSLAPRDDIAGLSMPEERIVRAVTRGVYLARIGDIRLLFLEKPFDLDTVLEVVKAATATKDQ